MTFPGSVCLLALRIRHIIKETLFTKSIVSPTGLFQFLQWWGGGVKDIVATLPLSFYWPLTGSKMKKKASDIRVNSVLFLKLACRVQTERSSTLYFICSCPGGQFEL